MVVRASAFALAWDGVDELVELREVARRERADRAPRVRVRVRNLGPPVAPRPCLVRLATVSLPDTPLLKASLL